MIKYRYYAVVCIGLGMLNACQYLGPDARTLAKVGDKTVRVREFKEAFHSMGSNFPVIPTSIADRKKVLDIVITQKILLIKANEECLQGKVPAVCNITSTAKNDSDLTMKYFNYLHTEELTPTAEEIHSYYAIHKNEFGLDQLVIRDIYTKTLPDARKALKELRKGKPFDAVAKRFSKDKKTARNGGKLAPFRLGSYSPSFEKIILSLPVNQAPQIVKVPTGYHIISKTGPPPPKPDDIMKIIKNGFVALKYKSWLSSARGSTPIQIDQQLLAQLSL